MSNSNYVYQYALVGKPGNGILQLEKPLVDGDQFRPWLERAIIADLRERGEPVDDEVDFTIMKLV